MIRQLGSHQTYDPARGSFMVHPLSVKDNRGKPKVKKIQGEEQFIFFSCNHVRGDTIIHHPHGYQFVLVPETR